MTTEERIQKIADEAIEKIRAIAAEKDEWPKKGDIYVYRTHGNTVFECVWFDSNIDKARKACRSIAPNTPEGRARLEKFSKWELFFADFMTAGDATPEQPAKFIEVNSETGELVRYGNYYGAIGQRGFSTDAKLDEWLERWGRDYVLSMLKGGMP